MGAAGRPDCRPRVSKRAKPVRPISLPRYSLLRFLDLTFPGNALRSCEFHPSKFKMMLESNLLKSRILVQRLAVIRFRHLRLCHHRCATVSQKAQPFRHFLRHVLTNKSPQAKHAETDPRHGTPTMAHFQPPDKWNQTCTDEHMHRRVGTPGKIHDMYLYV